MPKLLPIPEGAVEKLRAEMKQARTKDHYRRLLCVWMRVALGMPSRQIGPIVSWSAERVRVVQRSYLRQGESAFKRPGQGGRRRQNLSLRAERQFLAQLLEETRPNAILDARFIQAAYEKRVGHTVKDSVIYRLLARHGWRRMARGKVITPQRWVAAQLPKGWGPAKDWERAWPSAEL